MTKNVKDSLKQGFEKSEAKGHDLLEKGHERLEKGREFVTSFELQPKLRGVFHAWAFWVCLILSILLVVFAHKEKLAAWVYGLGLCALFAGSALYHRWRGNPRWKPVLRRIDHSTIFLFIAASYTPLCLIVLHGWVQVTVLVGVWIGALLGVGLSVWWYSAPRWLTALAYVALGWFALLAVPQLIEGLPVWPEWSF